MAEARLRGNVQVVVEKSDGEKVDQVEHEVREEIRARGGVGQHDAINGSCRNGLHHADALDHPLGHESEIDFPAIDSHDNLQIEVLGSDDGAGHGYLDALQVV